MGAAAAIAVLPFDNPSGDPEQGYLARGFVEELVTELARFPTLEVIHHHTSQALGSAAPAELGAAYHLRGSVRRLGERLRIHAQLVETKSGRQIWAERFDVPADGLLAVQDEIVARVATALRAEIDAVRLRGARRKPLPSLDVYDCWLRGMDHLRRGTLEDDERARAFFERALTLDPHSARAHAGLSLSHFNEWSCQLWERWEEKEQRAFEHASRAAALDDRDALIQIILGRIFLYRRRWDEGAKHVERALELTPSDADVLANAALCRAYLGDSAAGALLAERASRLNPRYPEWYLPCAAVPLFLLGRDAEAAALLSRSPRAFVDASAFLAAAHGMLGNRDEATRFADMFLAELMEKITFGRTPEPGEPLRWVLQVNPFRREEDAARFARGLAAAGLSSDPDERRARPVPGAARSSFRREADGWTVAFEGSAVQLADSKGLQDLAQLLAQPQQAIHCLELAGRWWSPPPIHRCSTTGRGGRSAPGSAPSRRRSTRRRRTTTRVGPTPRGRSWSRSWASSPARWAWGEDRAVWGARPNAPGAPSPGESATRSGRSPASMLLWAGTSTTRSAPGPTARTFRRSPSTGRSDVPRCLTM